MSKRASIEDLRALAAALAAEEYMVATNSGTYSAQEACRKVGTGDPHFADRYEYETVGGKRRATGPASAPGRMRRMSGGTLRAKRRELSDLRRQMIKGAK